MGKDLDEECGVDIGEVKSAEDKDSVKRTQEKATKLSKSQQKMAKSKATDNKDEVKSDKTKAEESKQIKVSSMWFYQIISISVI